MARNAYTKNGLGSKSSQWRTCKTVRQSPSACAESALPKTWRKTHHGKSVEEDERQPARWKVGNQQTVKLDVRTHGGTAVPHIERRRLFDFAGIICGHPSVHADVLRSLSVLSAQ